MLDESGRGEGKKGAVFTGEELKEALQDKGRQKEALRAVLSEAQQLAGNSVKVVGFSQTFGKDLRVIKSKEWEGVFEFKGEVPVEVMAIFSPGENPAVE